MKDIFCIISAIGNDYGVYSLTERYQQLLDTINSVKKFTPDAYICLYDTSENQIPGPMAVNLNNLVDRTVYLYDEQHIRHFRYMTPALDNNLTGKKTIGELIAMMHFLTWLEKEPTKFNRVFKLSGRYRLNENFNNIDYANHTKKAVFKEERVWHGDPVYTLRLWSFDYNLLQQVIESYKQILEFTGKTVNEMDRIPIIEYTTNIFFKKNNIPIIEISENIGVEGTHGQDGVYVNE